MYVASNVFEPEDLELAERSWTKSGFHFRAASGAGHARRSAGTGWRSRFCPRSTTNGISRDLLKIKLLDPI